MNQKGFTLLEVMLVMAIGGVLLLGVLLSIYQVVWGSARTNNQIVSLTDVNFAALRLKKDIQMAQSTNLIDGDPVPQNSVILSWTDYTGWVTDETRSHSNTYALSDNSTELRRTYDGTVSVVGRHITSLGFTQSNRVVTVVITATAPGALPQSKTLKFGVHLRPKEVW